MHLSLYIQAHAPFTYADVNGILEDVNGVLSIWQNLIIIKNIFKPVLFLNIVIFL